uniref:Ovule protein n=1 Tax=Parascaris univalens TaxID=6257 RepID=A0A915BCV8_PARUN
MNFFFSLSFSRFIMVRSVIIRWEYPARIFESFDPILLERHYFHWLSKTLHSYLPCHFRDVYHLIILYFIVRYWVGNSFIDVREMLHSFVSLLSLWCVCSL